MRVELEANDFKKKWFSSGKKKTRLENSWSLLCSAVLRSRADSLRLHVHLVWERNWGTTKREEEDWEATKVLDTSVHLPTTVCHSPALFWIKPPLPPPTSLALFVSSFFFLCLGDDTRVHHTLLPWYNCTGWLGIKHQFTYLQHTLLSFLTALHLKWVVALLCLPELFRL